jgi:hypothetical protein
MSGTFDPSFYYYYQFLPIQTMFISLNCHHYGLYAYTLPSSQVIVDLHIVTHIFQNLIYANMKVWDKFTRIHVLWIIIPVNILLVKIEDVS